MQSPIELNSTHRLWTSEPPPNENRTVKNPDRLRVGSQVRQLRIARGWTQEDLAARAGLHPTYVGGIERGERNLGLDNIIRLSRALGVHPSLLFEKIDK